MADNLTPAGAAGKRQGPGRPRVPPFRDLAPRLVALGYEPVAIRPGGKFPVLDHWQQGLPVARYLDADMGTWGVGILCRTTPAVDLDIRSRPLIRAMVELIDDKMGGCPVRFGQPPKALLPFHAEVPFAKVATRWFALPGEDFTAAGYRAHRCEVLGAGQQFVAFAIHPGTGWPYRWCRGDPFTQERVDLPHLDATAARRLMAAADRVFVAFGCVPLALTKGGVWLPWSERPAEATPRVEPGVAAALEGVPLATLALRVDPRAHRHGAGWRARCPVHRGESHTSLSLTEHDGLLLWHCFAGCSQAQVGAALLKIAS